MLPFARIGLADDRSLLNAWKLIQDLLNFTRIHVDAIDEKHVLFPVGDEVIAFFIAIADVTGQEPAAAHYLGSFLRLVPVAEHDVSPAHA